MDPSALALSCVLSGSGKVIKVDELLAAANPIAVMVEDGSCGKTTSGSLPADA